MSTFEHLPGALRWLRIKRKLRQADLARLVSLSRSRLSSYERGDTAPPLATLDRILVALSADAPELMAAMEVAASRPGLTRRRYRRAVNAMEVASPQPDQALSGLQCFLEAVAVEACRVSRRV